MGKFITFVRLKEFFGNTFNPFTFVFWIGVISTYVIGKRVNTRKAYFFLVTIILTIMITDTFKDIMAKFSKKNLEVDLIQWVIRRSGLVLLIFGLVLIYEVIISIYSENILCFVIF